MTGPASISVDRLEDVRELIASSGERLQPLGIKEVVRGRGCVVELPAILRRCSLGDKDNLVILTDATPKRYDDSEALKVVLGAVGDQWVCDVVVMTPGAGESHVLATEATVADALERTRRTGAHAVVSVGSGTVVDIAKVVAHELSLTHVVVQTAASVNGFADNQSVLLVRGVKRTTPSEWPDALCIDPSVVALAPPAMTRSGLGDLISMYTASADWCLAGAVGIDASFSPTLVAMMRRDVGSLMQRAGELGAGEADAVETLAGCLTRGGLAMGVAGRTAPSSGAEHTISHLLEMRADALGVPSASHGSQVGVASVFAALVWQRVRQRLAAGDFVVDVANLASRERVVEAFAHLDPTGAMAQECWSGYERKADWIRGHEEQLRGVVDDWPILDETFAGLLAPAAELAGALRAAGAAVDFAELDPAPPEDAVLWALAHCNLVRDRFGIVDIAALLGVWEPDDIASLRDEVRELAR